MVYGLGFMVYSLWFVVVVWWWKVESGKWKVQPDASGEKRPIDREVLEVTLKNKTPSAAFA